MSHSGDKCYGIPPRFNPEDGQTVAEVPAPGFGNWAGAPSAVYDDHTGDFFLYYRVRHPLTQGRGDECRIAKSRDGATFETVWKANKEDFGANSIEKASLMRDPGGRWRLYISYEVGEQYDRNPPTWRVDMMEADTPDQFDPARSRPVIDGPMFGFTFVKDPVVINVGGEYFVYTNVGLRDQHTPEDENGIIHSRGRGWCALHRSPDGIDFANAQLVMQPTRRGWDGFNVRITSICRLDPVWLAFYDGAANRADSYDEFCGLATSHDLIDFRRVSVREPWVTSPHGSKSIRYLEALVVGDSIHYFYEYTRPDCSHELRHNVLPLK